jgi:hypothetical protein
MARDVVHYNGRVIELSQRSLPGGGWVDLDVSWRGPDGSRIPVTELMPTSPTAAVAAEHQGGSLWRITVRPTNAQGATRRRWTSGTTNNGSATSVVLHGRVNGELLPVAQLLIGL